MVIKQARRKKPGMTVSLAVLAGLAPTALWAYDGFKQQGASEGVTRIVGRLSGYSISENKFQVNQLLKGWLPILAGTLAHKMAGRMGINRMIASAGIPILRI